jgi:AcrR family transcriptional regulator
MATSRFKNLDPEKQAKILDAAADEFAEKGYETASINQIIEQAGISKGSMYYYFEDKRDLYDTVIKDATERLLEMSGGFDIEQMQADNFWQYLKAYTERSLKQLRENNKYIQLARDFVQTQQLDVEDTSGSETMEMSRQITHQMIEHGQSLGVVRDDLPTEFLAKLSMSMGTVMDRWLFGRWDEMDEDEIQEFLDQEVDLIRRIWSPATTGGRDE